MDKEWRINENALALVAEPTVASKEEIGYSIRQIESKVDTGYYDGVGDELLKHIIKYLRNYI